MPADFLHGVETISIKAGVKTITIVPAAIIALVGAAPIFEVAESDRKINEPVQIYSAETASKHFGTKKTGFSIPYALDAILSQQEKTNPMIVVVNVFDPATHKSSLSSASKTFVNDVIDVGYYGLSNLVVKNTAGDATYVLNTDYTVDTVEGKITRKTGSAILAGASVKISCDYADPTKVTSSEIIGEVGVDGHRTGMQAFLGVKSRFGYTPRIFIAPEFSTEDEVAVALDVLSSKFKGVAYFDAPKGTLFDDVIAGRGPEGTINFNTGSSYAVPCYPHVKVFDTETNADILMPLSSYAAGVHTAQIIDNGYWWSPSNREIKGITGLEFHLDADFTDGSSETNILNSKGIMTVYNAYGSGFRLWGNRTAAFDAQAGIETFISTVMTSSVIEDSIEKYSLEFIDKPTDLAFTEMVTQSVNSFLRTLRGRGAIVDGKCWCDPEKNEPTEVANGHITFSYDFCPPPPAERLTFEKQINIEYLKNIFKQN